MTTPQEQTKKPKAAPAPPYPLPEPAAKAVAEMRKQLSDSRMGHLGRRVEALVRDAAESIDAYGSTVIVGPSFGGQRVVLPVRTTITQTVRVECNGRTVEYAFTVGAGAGPDAPRPEAKLDSFAAEVAPAPTASP